MEKWCTRCETTRSVEQFCKRKRGRDGLADWCKTCNSEYQREYRKANKDRLKLQQETWRIANIEHVRTRNHEHYRSERDRIRARARDYRLRNREKISARKRETYYENLVQNHARARQYYLENSEQVKQRARSWRKNNLVRARELRRVENNRRRAGLRSGAYTAQQISLRMAMFGHRCWICSGPFEQVDHVKPIARGGADLLCNLRPICAKCNMRKGAKWPLNIALGAISHDPILSRYLKQ